MRKGVPAITNQPNINLIPFCLNGKQSFTKLQQQMFDQTEFLTLNLLPSKLDDEIPDDKKAAYKSGYEEALVDAKIYFRTLIIRLLGENE